MRSTQTCPKCRGQKFLVKTEFRLPARAINATEPFPAVTIDRHDQKQWATITTGQFEAWICLGCGYTEFYAYGIQNYAVLVQGNPDQLRIVDATPPEHGPYR